MNTGVIEYLQMLRRMIPAWIGSAQASLYGSLRYG